MRLFVPATAERIHQMLSTPIDLPVGTTPQELVSVNVAGAIATYKSRYRSESRFPLPPARARDGRELMLLNIAMYFSRPSNAGSATIYHSVDGLASASFSPGTSLQSSGLWLVKYFDNVTTVSLRASQSAAVGWQLAGYTVWVLYYGFTVNDNMWIDIDVNHSPRILSLPLSQRRPLLAVRQGGSIVQLYDMPSGVGAWSYFDCPIVVASGPGGAALILSQLGMAVAHGVVMQPTASRYLYAGSGTSYGAYQFNYIFTYYDIFPDL